MKPQPRDHQRVRDLALKLIEQKLAQPVTAEEVEWFEGLERLHLELFQEPYPNREWARKEARRLYWEAQLGLDQYWEAPSPEVFPGAVWERFLAVKARELQS